MYIKIRWIISQSYEQIKQFIPKFYIKFAAIKESAHLFQKKMGVFEGSTNNN